MNNSSVKLSNTHKVNIIFEKGDDTHDTDPNKEILTKSKKDPDAQKQKQPAIKIKFTTHQEVPLSKVALVNSSNDNTSPERPGSRIAKTPVPALLDQSNTRNDEGGVANSSSPRMSPLLTKREKISKGFQPQQQTSKQPSGSKPQQAAQKLSTGGSGPANNYPKRESMFFKVLTAKGESKPPKTSTGYSPRNTQRYGSGKHRTNNRDETGVKLPTIAGGATTNGGVSKSMPYHVKLMREQSAPI